MHGSFRPPAVSRDAFSRDIVLERRLTSTLEGTASFDAFTRGRYATDASIYQIMPLGVVFPRSADDVAATLAIARERGVPVIMRGAGTSQNGQPIGAGLVVDCSRHLNRTMAYDRDRRSITVEPGTVLERLNAALRPDGLFFPVEPSTASRCTIGGMTGNNSCGARSIRYGKMVDNVGAVEAITADGERRIFDAARAEGPGAAALTIVDRERDEIERRFPKVQRRVGGYNFDALTLPTPNLAALMVGSEGTLAAFTSITLELSHLPTHRVMGVCHFPSFRAAMEATAHLVALGPVAVELVDNNVLTLGADIPLFVATLNAITRGAPNCLLLVEFAGPELAALGHDLARLDQCMGDLGYPSSVVAVTDAGRQKQVWDVREACLNIMMSMKGDGKPVSFIEDCAVPLDRLADYTDAVSAVFEKHGTRGTWYAHASVGCLHVRPILNMKTQAGVAAMREIADETSEIVRRFEGSFSGEHGDGISRSDYIAPMFGARLAEAFAEVKDAFDRDGILNPGKIVRPYAMDDRSIMRFPESYGTSLPALNGLDWTKAGGFGAAVEMCNNNGTCRKVTGGNMCPSYRVTRDETHVTRGRANVLRLAISGQLGPDALTSQDMADAMDLCVGCKACRRECPTGVDMARMKIEVAHQRRMAHGVSLKDRVIAHLPRYAFWASRLRSITNLPSRVPAVAAVLEIALGFSSRRKLPLWVRPFSPARPSAPDEVKGDGRDLVVFADTFNTRFEPRNLEAALRVLAGLGYRIHHPAHDGRALCCGRTYLSAGMVPEARDEIRRTVASLLPYVRVGARIVGLEPSCLLTLRDEIHVLLPDVDATTISQAAFLFEEILAADLSAGRIAITAEGLRGRTLHLHGHCHQKAHDAMGAVETVLKALPGVVVRTIDSSCCGMAGAFGYDVRHRNISLAMAELSLLPAVRAASPDDLIVADGTSCRHQIADGSGRSAIHVAAVLDLAMGTSP